MSLIRGKYRPAKLILCILCVAALLNYIPQLLHHSGLVDDNNVADSRDGINAVFVEKRRIMQVKKDVLSSGNITKSRGTTLAPLDSYRKDLDNSHQIMETPSLHHSNPASWQGSDSADSSAIDKINIAKLKLEMRSDRNSTKHIWPWGKVKQCVGKAYDVTSFPSVSVIIAFHENEALVDVMHTLHSIIQRSPSSILKEIILVDDNSSKDDFRGLMENYLKSVFYKGVVRVLRSDSPLGLIKARLKGIRAATGDVIVSMDSHMEVQERWLEPLLQEIVNEPKTLAASYLDWMEPERDGTWTYKHGASTWKTYFDWNFVFGFQDINPDEHRKRQKDPTQPVMSPVTIGTLFAIRKDFFQSIGEFDEAMEGWGGENLDLPIRVWLCGGRVINVPCSHAGHLEKRGHRDYRRTWENKIYTNYKRVAEVWLDDYKKYFYMYNPYIEQNIHPGDLTARRSLKHQCSKDFGWYLDTVFPELGLPDKHGFAWGGLQNLEFKVCLYGTSQQTLNVSKCHGDLDTELLNERFTGHCLDAYPGSMSVALGKCVRDRPKRQGFFWDTDGLLRFPVHAFTVKNEGEGRQVMPLEYIPVRGTDEPTRWIHTQGGFMKIYGEELCLTAVTEYRITFTQCDPAEPRQKWSFAYYTPHYSSLIDGKAPHKESLSYTADKFYTTLIREAQVSTQSQGLSKDNAEKMYINTRDTGVILRESRHVVQLKEDTNNR